MTLERFLAISPEFAEMLALDPDNGLPQWMRVLFLASTRVNRIGHAEFARGELGELLHVNKSRVTDAVARLRDLKYVEQESCSQCIVIPRRFLQQARLGATARCRYHEIE